MYIFWQLYSDWTALLWKYLVNKGVMERRVQWGTWILFPKLSNLHLLNLNTHLWHMCVPLDFPCEHAAQVLFQDVVLASTEMLGIKYPRSSPQSMMARIDWLMPIPWLSCPLKGITLRHIHVVSHCFSAGLNATCPQDNLCVHMHLCFFFPLLFQPHFTTSQWVYPGITPHNNFYYELNYFCRVYFWGTSCK